MPGLGFLKKKRTRDDKQDPSSAATKTTSNTTTGSAASKIKSNTSHGSGKGQDLAPVTSFPGTTSPFAQQQQAGSPSQGPSSSGNTGGGPAGAAGPGAGDGGGAGHQQPSPQQPHQSSSNTNSSNTYTNDPQNPASINNSSANASQHDSAAATRDVIQNNNQNPLANGRPSLTPGGTPLPSTSPGTDPHQLLQQQRQALPKPDMQQPDGQSHPQGLQQHQQQQQYQPPAQQQQQQTQVPQQQYHHHQPHHQAHSSMSQPRVTKGKYSLPDFEILRTLGTGSFGRVHLVQSNHNQRFYAIKVLKKAQVVKMKQVEHTNDERRMLSDVKHPFLVTLWGTFQDWKNLYMVMDFVEGGELFSLLRKSGRFPNPVAKFYAAEVTLALEYMHSKNIVYRDLKPENLLLDRHGHLKITDFGFAKRVPDKTWTLCGTPDYLAPEVVSNKGYNKSVDWWSLGILIYEMLCGYTPFWDSGSPMKIYENILKGKIKYPAYINGDAQDLLQRLITADLTKRLGNLYGGPQDVKSHPWFSEVTWDRLARKDIDAPYTPPVKAGAGDASQFDKYPEDPDKYGGSGGNDEYGHLFVDF